MSRKRKRSRKSIALVILGVILAWGIYYYYRVKPRDYTSTSQKIDSRINEELVKLGVADKDIVKVYREEKQKGNITWVEITKEVQVSPEVDWEKCKKVLGDAVGKVGATVYQAEVNEKEKSLALKIGKYSLIMQRLVLRYPLPRYRVSIVIDDVGQRKDLLKNFLRLGIPLTFAILPQLEYSTYLAQELKNSGYETILHLPMEPENYPAINPGPGALLESMNFEEIRDTILSDLKSVPGVSGVSNHEGSRLTANREKMREVLGILKDSGLFFLDSRTSSHSVIQEVGREIGMDVLSNNVFLDGEDDYGYISKKLGELKLKVLQSGVGIGIAHIQRRNTPRALADLIKNFRNDGIEFVVLSELVRR